MAPIRSMKLLAWNCEGLGGPSTIAQSKESIRLYLPDITFIIETKHKKGFLKTVCKRLMCKDRWDVVDPTGRKGVLLIFWGDNVKICQMIKSAFCIEVEVECDSFEGRYDSIRKQQ